MIAKKSVQSQISSVPQPTYYTVRWVSDGLILQEETYTSPAYANLEYLGDIPIKASDDNYRYEFLEWSKNEENHSIIFTAIWKTYQRYTVKWVSESTILQTSYYYEGEAEPTYTGTTPTKATSSTHTYVFSSWNKSISGTITTYTAQFAATRYYTWERYNIATSYTIVDLNSPEVGNNSRFWISDTATGKVLPGSFWEGDIADLSLEAEIWYDLLITRNPESIRATHVHFSRTRPTINATTGIISYPSPTKSLSLPRSDNATVIYRYSTNIIPNSYKDYYIWATGGGGQYGLGFSVSGNTNDDHTIGISIGDDYETFRLPFAWFGTYGTGKIGLIPGMVKKIYSKGATKYSNVTSTSSTAYPDDGVDDSYYYVKIS